MLCRCQIVALFFLLVSCHTAFAKDLISAEQLPEWFAESLQDEKNVTLRSYLKIQDLGISKKVMGELEIAPVGDSAWNFVNDIGTASPLDCYVLTEFDGPATSRKKTCHQIFNTGAFSLTASKVIVAGQQQHTFLLRKTNDIVK